MRRTTVLWEVFVTRFEEAFDQYKRRRLTGEEAGELLGMSGRSFRRLCLRYEEDGIEGLRDRRIGKTSPRRAPARELERMHDLYRERYSDFTVKHFHEQLQRHHHYKLDYTVTRLSLQSAGLSPRPSAAVPTARSGCAGRCRACCCSRTARPVAGLPGWSADIFTRYGHWIRSVTLRGKPGLLCMLHRCLGADRKWGAICLNQGLRVGMAMRRPAASGRGNMECAACICAIRAAMSAGNGTGFLASISMCRDMFSEVAAIHPSRAWNSFSKSGFPLA